MNIDESARAAPPKRVAIIAVHGVGSPPTGQTARGVTELLMQGADAEPRYRWFEERTVTIPTAPIAIGIRSTEPSSMTARATRAFNDQASDRTSFVLPTAVKTDAGKAVQDAQQASIEEAALRPDIAFSRELLRGYESKGVPYKTIETVGMRHDDAGNTEVHVFEMHWADLSRVGTGVLGIFGSAYQLVQHFSHLGRKTLDVATQVAKAYPMLPDAAKAKIANPGPHTQWGRYSAAHAWVIRCFTVLIPVTAVLMIAFVPLFIPAGFSPGSRFVVGLVACAALVIIVGGIGIYFAPADRWSATIFVGFMAVITAVAVAAFVRHWPVIATDRFGTVLLTTAVAALTLGSVFGLLRTYNRNRPGALLYGFVAAYSLFQATRTTSRALLGTMALDPAERVRQFAFIGLQEAYALLMLTWIALLAVVIVTIALRVDVVRRTTGLGHLRAKRAAFTARVSLALSAFSFIVAALVFYRSLLYLAEKGAGRFGLLPLPLSTGELPTIHIPGLMPGNYSCGTDRTQACAVGFFEQLIGQSGTSGFVIAVFGLGVVLVLMSWFIALIAATSIRNPDPAAGNGRRLGLWMTDGFRWLRIAGTALGLTLLLAVSIGIVLGLVPSLQEMVARRVPLLGTMMRPSWTAAAIKTLTIAVLASAASIGAARIRVEALASKARPTIGLALDVDNYLRETPANATPRAQMFERYVSLLRYIERCGNFDRVVIVSHSQGTIISTDLLRFLQLGLRDADHELVSADRFRLLTMGCPLRQMYGVNFPYLSTRG